MPVEWSARFKRDFYKLPTDIQDRVERLMTLLDGNREHPSLQLKRIQRLPGHWEARISCDLRVIMVIKGDLFILLGIGKHDILDTFKNN